MAKPNRCDIGAHKSDSSQTQLAEIVEAAAVKSGLSPEAASDLTEKIVVGLKHILVQRETWKSFSGPMPPPELLKKYEEQIPEMAQELWNEILEEGKTDRWCQKVEAVSVILAQICAYTLGMSGLVLGFILAKDGVSGPSVSAMLSGVGTIVAGICGKYFFYKEKKK